MMTNGDEASRVPTEDLPTALEAFVDRRDELPRDVAAVSRAATLLALSQQGARGETVVDEARLILELPHVSARPSREEVAETLMQIGGRASVAGEMFYRERADRRFLREFAASLPDDAAAFELPEERIMVEGQQADAAASALRGFETGPDGDRYAARLAALSLVDPHPLVRVAAAAAVVRSDRRNPLAHAILEDGRVRRNDEVSRLAAAVSYAELGNRYRRVEVASGGPKREESPDSAVVHGTWARGGTWWKPDGLFSTFLKDEAIFPKLYAGSDPFRWSGFFSVRAAVKGPAIDWDRLQAGSHLAWWAERRLSEPPDFVGHSYGASITMCATRVEKQMRAAVLLSPAVHESCLPDPRFYAKALIVRMKLDLVLLVDRSKLGLLRAFPNVDERVLPRRGLTGHSATHDPDVWRASQLDEFVRDEWLPG